MESNTNTRGRQISTLKSKPRESESTIMDNMSRIMQLVAENKEIDNKRRMK